MRFSTVAIALVLTLAGCASVNIPVTTVSDPSRLLSKATAIAIYREPDMRIQKRLFAQRIERYLAEAGFNVVDSDEAEILVAIHIATERLTIVHLDTGFTPRPNWRTDTRIKDGESRFSFLAYESESLRTREPKTVWEGSVVVAQKVMQQNERALLLELFSHFGASFDGKARIETSVAGQAAAPVIQSPPVETGS